jgi:hypothetical protein
MCLSAFKICFEFQLAALHLEPAPPIEIDYVIRTLSTLQHGRGSHSFTSLFNLSVFNGKGGARRDCVARVKGVLGGV